MKKNTKVTVNKIFINLGIILFSIGLVMTVRVEARKTSYQVNKKFSVLKHKRQNLQKTTALYHKKNGLTEALSIQAETMAVKSNKARQVVMVQNNLMVTHQ